MNRRTAKTLAYNAENRLANVSDGNGASEGYLYDGDGVRVARVRPGEATYLFMGGLYEVTLALPSGTVTGSRSYYTVEGQMLAMSDGSSTSYLLTDHLGSVVGVVDGSGALVSEQRYLPFGQVRTDLSGITATDLSFTGQRALTGTGLIDYHARQYDPALRTFIQADTIIADNDNTLDWYRYLYSRANPLKYTDPTGHCVVICTAIIGGAIGAIGGGIAYTVANNGKNFDNSDFILSVSVGAIAGASIGSGVGLIAAPAAATGIAGVTTAATINTAGTILIGGGTGAAGSGLSYVGSTAGNFEPDDFVVSTSIGGITGAISAATPLSTGGVAIKGLTYVAGAEVQYGLTTNTWTTHGAIQAAQYGGIAAAFDVGISAPFQSIPGTTFAGVYPTGNPAQTTAVLRMAARQRYGVSLVNVFTGLASGVGSGILTHHINQLEEQ